MRDDYAGYTKPIVLLAFADPDQDLKSLKLERRQLREILEQARAKGFCDYIILPDANITDISRELERAENQNRIAIFHYAGHANSKLLMLVSEEDEQQPAEAKGLAAMLQQQTTLRLVFLNACSTEQQVEKLREKVPHANVIATSRAVEDAVAVAFAKEFYLRLGEGAGIKDAYERATKQILTNHHATNFRKAVLEDEDEVDDIKDEQHEEAPWKLYASHAVEEAAAEEETVIRPERETAEAAAPIKEVEWETDSDWPPAHTRRARKKQIVVTLEQWKLREAIKDPLFGLPRVFSFPRPSSPFRPLIAFERADAGIFAGRERELRQLYERLNNERAAPIILLSGQAGVGKSSLLEAGLIPRLISEDSKQIVRSRRRAQATGLLGTLRAALQAEPNGSIAQAWRQLEQQANRPLIVIIDQVDEVFAKPAQDVSASQELHEFCTELGQMFAGENGAERPAGKLLLGVRKERLAEIGKRLSQQRLGYEVLAINPLDYWRIVRAISVAENYYDLTLEQGILSNIADDLLADDASSIAPVLQIILAQMWERVVNEPPERRAFTRRLYWEVKDQALKQFFEGQLAKLKAAHPTEVETGLALDLLLSHTTADGTLRARGQTELEQDYRHCQHKLRGLLQDCKDLYLLTDYYPAGGAAQTRLIHKALSPIIWSEYSRSLTLGQRARRVIEYRTHDLLAATESGQKIKPLTQRELKLVERGQAGMRVWSEAEQGLVTVSRKQRWVWRVVGGSVALVVLLMVAALAWLYVDKLQEREQARQQNIKVRDAVLFRLLTTLAPPTADQNLDEHYGKTLPNYVTRLTADEASRRAVMEKLKIASGDRSTNIADLVGPIVEELAEMQLDAPENLTSGIALRPAARQEEPVTYSAAAPAPPPPLSNTLVYMHIQREDQRKPANEIRARLAQQGYDLRNISTDNVGNIKIVANQVRYFRPSDEASARQLVAALTQAGVEGVQLRWISSLENSPLVKPNQLEVWFTGTAFTEPRPPAKN